MSSAAPSVSPSLLPSLSFSPTIITSAPSLSPTISSAPSTQPTIDLTYDDDELIALISISLALLIFGVIGTWLLSKFADRFLSTEIDEAILRRIEQMINDRNQNRRKNVVLDGMTDEERLRVLERVLDVKPYSRELGAQLKMEREQAEENEKIQKAIIESSLPEQANQKTAGGDDAGSNKGAEGEPETPKEGEDVNILQRVWEEFGGSKNIKKGKRESDEQRIQREENEGEVTETCAICMEDYEENQDVIIGHSCDHMYHKECLLKWMCMEARHDLCPYCRKIVFSEQTFRKTAEEIVGTDRYQELIKDEQDIEEGVTPTPTDSEAVAEDDNQGQEGSTSERTDQDQ